MAEPKTRRDFEAEIIARAWKVPDFKKRLIANPKTVLQEEVTRMGGGKLPDDLKVTAVEETPNQLYVVMPLNPAKSQELSEEQLEAVAGGTVAVIVVGVGTVVAVGVTAYTYVS